MAVEGWAVLHPVTHATERDFVVDAIGQRPTQLS